ncbi:hypothetical protein UPYG_G00270060 [Umbra pygmaea]|uniref:CEP152 CEP63 binding coiled coil domain-containing protein n=1 Tax=Umbra pygmaea TaxID=75934 RepID=A0ABD0WFT1_UMBPY
MPRSSKIHQSATALICRCLGARAFKGAASTNRKWTTTARHKQLYHRTPFALYTKASPLRLIMSIDFDSAALQTQHEEEEFDPEDYARERELHKLLTDLPDDMLEDSRDSSSPEHDCSHHSNLETGNRQQPAWNQPITEWPNHQTAATQEEDYRDNFDHGSYHEDYRYENGTVAVQINGHASHPQQNHPLAQAWNQQQHEFEDYQPFSHAGGYTYSSMGTEQSAATIADSSTEEGYGDERYPRGTVKPGLECQGVVGAMQSYAGGQNNTRNHFQKLSSEGSGDHYKASYNPYPPASQPKMFNTEVPHQNQDGSYDQLQREYLDCAQSSADGQQLAQLQILKQAQLRQIEDLERKLEDTRRNMRYLEHQYAIMKDEKEGLAVSLKESGGMMEEYKERELQLQTTVSSLELQVQTLTDRDQENIKKQCMAEAALDSMQKQMAELCRSESLSRVREQHDRDLTVVREQHDAQLLGLQQRLDSSSQALEEQADVVERLQGQLREQGRRREEEQLERAGVINTLTQRLEDSQRQCASLLQTGSVQEVAQLQIKLQQASSAKTMSDNMNKALQEELSELKEQISLYESAVKHGVISVDATKNTCSWEAHLSDSYVELGIQKTSWRNGRLHSTPMVEVSEPNHKLPVEKDDGSVRELRAELQRCLATLKGKRRRISQLQEDLGQAQAQVGQLQTQLDQNSSTAEPTVKPGDRDAAAQTEVRRLEEDRQSLQERLELLERKNAELKQSEEKVKAANSELCTKMREMIQELDQEKQEAAERYERTQQQFRDDVVTRVRSELALEHHAVLDGLTAEHQGHLQQLQDKLTEVNAEMLAVQECYISVCKEKDRLEEKMQVIHEEEEKRRVKEVCDLHLKASDENRAALEKLKADLETQHQATVAQLRTLWAEEKDSEVKRLVQAQQAADSATWRKEKEKIERSWSLRLEAAVAEARRKRSTDTRVSSSQTFILEEEKACQTTSPEETKAAPGCSVKELEARLQEQRLQLQREADVSRCKAVEDARKRVERELQEKHLADMAKQVEGAVTRAYSRWLEDLASLPEYKEALQRERDQWDHLQEQHLQEKVSAAVAAAEERWLRTRPGSAEESEQEGCEGERRVQELQEEVQRWRQLEEDLKSEVEEVAHLQNQVDDLQNQVDDLQNQLQREREQKATLLKAELAAARASWNRDKQQEISSLVAFQQEQLERVREEAERRRQELLLQKEAEWQQAVRSREEEWRGTEESRGQEQRRLGREEVLREVDAGLKEVQDVLLKGAEDAGQLDTSTSTSVRDLLISTCRHLLSEAVAQAKKDWLKVSEERLGHVLKETQERHEKEINHIHNCAAQKSSEGRCGKQCAEMLSKLQKRCQDLQKHLEKACRQLQTTVKDHKAATLQLKEEFEAALRKVKEDNKQKLEEVKRSAAKESSGGTDVEQCLHAGLEEMRDQYLKAVEKIRGDMLRYLQESKERAAEMIRVEVLRERQDTARKMRRYYLTCLQELLEDGGRATGAEKKIINAASKLAAMAKVLETPTKRNVLRHRSPGSSSQTQTPADRHPGNATGSGPGEAHQSPATGDAKTPRTSRGERRTLKTKVPSEHESGETAKSTQPSRPSDKPGVTQECSTNSNERGAPANTPGKPLVPRPGHSLSLAYRLAQQTGPTTTSDCYHGDLTKVSLRNKSSRELYLLEAESGRSESDNFLCHRGKTKPFLIQEELPVRDEGGSTDWSLSSNGSQDGNHALAVSSYPGRKMETGNSFPVYGTSSTDELGRFGCHLGSLSTDNSDITIYEEMANVQCGTKALTAPRVLPQVNDFTQSVSMNTQNSRFSHRQPVLGSEGDRQNAFQNHSQFQNREFQNVLCSKSQFSELQRSQRQDSGFDSPFSQQK